MKKQIPLFLLSAVTTILHSQSVVETHTFFSPTLGEDKSYLIYLPDEYGLDTSVHYPCVYFLRLHETEWFNPDLRTDGETLKDVADDLVANGTIGKMIIVGPSTGGNDQDFTDIGIVNMLQPDLADDDGIGTGAFEDYFFQDLIPHIDSAYRTVPEWCARGVDGFSLGGFASTLYALKHPGVFSSVGSYDGTIMWYNLDYPVTPGPWDDYTWLFAPYGPLFAPMFGSPLDTAYMLTHSATNILTEADPVTLDSIQQMSFHISCGYSNGVTNKEVNEQFVDSLAAKGITNTFTNVVLQAFAIHNFNWADVHAEKSLPMHWQTFVSLACAELPSGINDGASASSSITLFQNFPNPANSNTTITFEIPEQAIIKIDLYDSFGKKVRELVNDNFPQGKHQVQLDVAEFADGVYYYRLENNSKILTKKLMVFNGA